MKTISHFKGSMLLSAIGDALGWMTEFEHNETDIIKKFGKTKIDSFHNWTKKVGGPYLGYIDNIKAGSYSDDTQLTLAVSRCINSNGIVD